MIFTAKEQAKESVQATWGDARGRRDRAGVLCNLDYSQSILEHPAYVQEVASIEATRAAGGKQPNFAPHSELQREDRQSSQSDVDELLVLVARDR